MQVFEYVTILHKRNPYCCSCDDEITILNGPIVVAARDAEAVKKLGIRNAKWEGDAGIEDVEVLVRPFV